MCAWGGIEFCSAVPPWVYRLCRVSLACPRLPLIAQKGSRTDCVWWDAPCSLTRGKEKQSRKSQATKSTGQRQNLSFQLSLLLLLSWDLRYNPCNHTGPKGLTLNKIFFGDIIVLNKSWPWAPVHTLQQTLHRYSLPHRVKQLGLQQGFGQLLHISTPFGDWEVTTDWVQGPRRSTMSQI